MGYDVHITRAENWANNSGFEISSEEWINLIQSEPELIPIPENGKYFVAWHGTTRYPETWFDWTQGNIYTKAPDRATLFKMLQIARKLNAKVQGDEGELYDEEYINAFNDSFLSHQASSRSKKNGTTKPPVFFRIILGLLIISFIIFLILWGPLLLNP